MRRNTRLHWDAGFAQKEGGESMKKQITITFLLTIIVTLASSPGRATTTTVTEFLGIGTDRTVYPNDVTSDGLMVGVSSNNATDKAVLWSDPATPPEMLLGAPGIPSLSSNALAI